jgi:hypothetical protein
MGTVYGTLTATGGGGPVNSQDKIQFKNRTTYVVTEVNVSDTGQYTTSLAVGTYDIGVNGTYGGNTPSSIVVTTLPKYQNIISENTKDEVAAGARAYRLWVVDPADLTQFASWGALKQFAADIEAQGYLVHAERAQFKVAPHNVSHSGTCPIAAPHTPTNDWADALIVLHINTSVETPPKTTLDVTFLGGALISL